jgi:bifunctional non-homologous end joining protein LigD
VADLDRPDFVLFDLDPGRAPFGAVVEIAQAIHQMLKSERLDAYVKTSGKSGLHVLVPWTRAGDFDEARAWALERAERVVAERPDRATVEQRKEKRGDRVYIDVLQNARGHHAVPPYVLRAIPRATVSTPLRWNELGARLDPAQFTTGRVLRRLSRLARDPFERLLATWQGTRRVARSSRGRS